VERSGQPPKRADERLRQAADGFAGRWVCERVATRANVDLGRDIRGRAAETDWEAISSDRERFLNQMCALLPADAGLTSSDFRDRLSRAIETYTEVRDGDDLWRKCMGKEVLATVHRRMGATDSATLERQVQHLYANGAVEPPAELAVLRAYITELPFAQ
jgi:hypothetical protein